MYDYNLIIRQSSERVFEVMAPRVSPEDLERIKDAFALAQEKHAAQKRKSGEPYIIHPIAVALIAAEELKLDANSVITAFLHDVVEDTDFTIEQVRERFGAGAYIEWRWMHESSGEWGTLVSSDPHISRGGMWLTVTPADVASKTSFSASLVVP